MEDELLPLYRGCAAMSFRLGAGGIQRLTAGVMTDTAPTVNIPPFGMCSSLSNPTVASATSAAMGVLTPMPCVPVPAGPWLNPVPKVSIGGQSAISNGSKLMCAWGGQITVQSAGQTSVQV